MAVWPKLAVNYTVKTQFLFRINKGVLDVSNDNDLNVFTPVDERPIPFRNMIYIGDGMTDVPCMRLVKANGGSSIAEHKKDDVAKVQELLRDKRENFISLVDYLDGGKLDEIVKNVFLKMKTVDVLVKEHCKQKLKIGQKSKM